MTAKIFNGLSETINKKSIKEAVLQKIDASAAKMIPKWHFVLRAALIAAVFILITLVVFYIASFVFFILNKTGVFLLPAFGWRGIEAFLASLPWPLIFAGAGLVILLEALINRYPFSYRQPLLYSLAGIIILVVAGSMIVSQTRLHEGLSARAMKGELSFIGQLYRDYESERNSFAHIGVVREITGDGFQMENFQGETISIFVTSETGFPEGVNFQKGDRVVVFGDRDDDTVEALAIRKVNGGVHGHSKRNRGWYRPMMFPMMQQ